MTGQSDSQIEWAVSEGLTDYASALAQMEARAAAIAQGEGKERIWLLEHPPLYTAGTSADPAEMLDPRFPVFTAGRGGRYTYHGPGQAHGLAFSVPPGERVPPSKLVPLCSRNGVLPA